MYRYIQARGYHGYSMSNNAIDAYESGEKPLSKWTKSAILDELVEQNVLPEIIELAKKMDLKQLKEVFLYESSWHHTSKMYNRTKFYSVADDVPLSIVQSEYNRFNQPESHRTWRACKVYYKRYANDETYHIGYAIFYKNKYFLEHNGEILMYFDGTCEPIEWYENIPQGQEETFNKIKSYLGV